VCCVIIQPLAAIWE